MSSARYTDANRYSIIYAKHPTQFPSSLTVPPFNPLSNHFPFNNVNLECAPRKLTNFSKILSALYYDERVLRKLHLFIDLLKSWLQKLSPATSTSLSFGDRKDIQKLIWEIVVARFGSPEEGYCEYQALWWMLMVVMVANEMQHRWHPDNVYYSALFYSPFFGGGRSSRARALLLNCWVRPFMIEWISVRQYRDESHRAPQIVDVRAHFEFDPASFGAKSPSKHKDQPTAAAAMDSARLSAKPMCSQDVAARVRMRLRNKKRHKITDYFGRRTTNVKTVRSICVSLSILNVRILPN